ncbi:MAG: branched-chain amino acid ABC transporter permease [Neptuniibacter sp.]
MIETIFQGLLLGGLYCIFALGLSLMFGVMRLTNIALGDQIIISGFIAIGIAAILGLNVLLIGICILPIAFISGYLFQRMVLNPTLSKDPLPSLVVTFGLSIVIQNVLQEVFSANPRSLDSGGLNTESFSIGADLHIGVLPVIIFITAIICTYGLQLLFAKTALGRSFRAVSDDKEVAELMGMSAKKVYATATGIAFCLIAIAGVFQSMRTTVAPADGPSLLLFAFEAVIIGGMGSFWGTFVGAMVLGISQQIGFKFDPGWGIWFGHLVFIIILFIKPNGLFPKTKG